MQIWGLFCNLIALILNSNRGRCLGVTKVVKKIKFEKIWDELEAKKIFPERL